ncbi:hypothetical protein JYB87_18390 [Shewanella avicenniae]|uniref:Uncharacterized protein n=1 Tax=Shewanella avicenniae TaxID=2814294 RepID=A0ABX7QQ97_9GAMM|nr:hypothetical protein [Shewanella avicenniae]QSX33647.1 hypothetical protein JYB87_18390 [Shewanella avicenniae]
MKGWILIAIAAGVIYYLATRTDKLDEPIAQTEAMLNKIERKLDAMTGTQIIRIDKKKAQLKASIGERLSGTELTELDSILSSADSFSEFKDEYCQANVSSHPVFSRDNLQFICDNL